MEEEHEKNIERLFKRLIEYSNVIEEVRFLLSVDKPAIAKEKILDILAENPDDGDARLWLAMCLYEENKIQEALTEAKRAIASAPQSYLAHCILAQFLIDIEDIKGAKKEIEQAIEIEPENSLAFGLLAYVYGVQNNWQEALRFAEEGLKRDPEDETCKKVRIQAITFLKKHDEAQKSAKELLQDSPTDSTSHLMIGYVYLSQQDYDRALASFQKSLELNPTDESAKEGILEALKARYWIYRLLLRYSFWALSLTPKQRILAWVGIYLLFRFANAIAKTSPELTIIILPFIILYVLFITSLFVTEPIINFFLRFSPYARSLLSHEDILQSNLTAICLLGALLYLLLGFLLNLHSFIFASFVFFFFLFPLNSYFHTGKRTRRWFGLAVGFIGLLGFLSVLFSIPDNEVYTPLAFGLLVAFIITAILSTWAKRL